MVCFRDTIVNILHRGGDNNYNSNNDDNNNHVINLSIQIKADLQPIRKIQESGHYTVKKHPFYMQANSTPDIMHCNPQSTLCTSTPSPHYAPQPPVHIMHLNSSPHYAPQPPVHIMHLNPQSTLCTSTSSPHYASQPPVHTSVAILFKWCHLLCSLSQPNISKCLSISDHATQNRQQPFRERISRLRPWWLVSIHAAQIVSTVLQSIPYIHTYTYTYIMFVSYLTDNRPPNAPVSF